MLLAQNQALFNLEQSMLNLAITFCIVAVPVTTAVFGLILLLLNRTQTLSRQLFELQDKLAKAELKEQRCQSELTAAFQRIARLEKTANIGLGDPIVGQIHADLKGVIHSYSPSLTPLLGWQPEEVEGRAITVLMPERLRGQALIAFKAVVERRDFSGFDSVKTHVTEALDRRGHEVRVAIRYRVLDFASRGCLIRATIREVQEMDESSPNPARAKTNEE